MGEATETQITRRAALAALGTSALGFAFIGTPLLTDESRTERLSKLLPKFTERSRSAIVHLLDDPAYSGRIPAGIAGELAKNENLTADALMAELLPFAQSYSVAPISNFHVGAIVRAASGDLYTGANIEIPGQCLGFAVHAEQSACSNAYMHEEKSIAALAVDGAPCGHCRQFMEEMSPDGEMLILTPNQPPMKLSSILPSAFSPSALGMKHGAFPVPDIPLSAGAFSGDALVFAALQAARKSHAPYSKSPAGAAIRTVKGRIYRGSYIENVAFNPSLSPLQTALAAMIAGGESFSDISAVALVEAERATISQRAVTETVLQAIAPTAKLFASTAPLPH
jgi:cytidine deaminase